jgi:hypothetical protein
MSKNIIEIDKEMTFAINKAVNINLANGCDPKDLKNNEQRLKAVCVLFNQLVDAIPDDQFEFITKMKKS